MGQNEEMAWLEQLRYWEEKRDILETKKEYWELKLEMLKSKRNTVNINERRV